MPLKIKFNFFALILTLLLFGCVDKNGIVVGTDGKPVRITENEINQKRCTLSRAGENSDFHDRLEGTAIFEGVVISKQNSTAETVTVKVNVSWILCGVKGKEVEVETAENSPYGINFQIGEGYRIAAYEENGKLITWSWMGTYKIKDKPICN